MSSSIRVSQCTVPISRTISELNDIQYSPTNDNQRVTVFLARPLGERNLMIASTKISSVLNAVFNVTASITRLPVIRCLSFSKMIKPVVSIQPWRASQTAMSYGRFRQWSYKLPDLCHPGGSWVGASKRHPHSPWYPAGWH